MSKTNQTNAMDLIKQARALGLVGANESVNCFHCNAIFPNSYDSCPNCNSTQS